VAAVPPDGVIGTAAYRDGNSTALTIMRRRDRVRPVHNRSLNALVSMPRRRLLFLAAGTYAGLVVAFGLVQWSIGGLSESGVGGAMYFSLITQATVGYGDVHPLTGAARSLVALQVVAGVAFLALVPAVLILRMLSPSDDAIAFSRYGVFDPIIGQFRFRFVNDSALPASARAEIHLPLRVPRDPGGDRYTTHFDARLESSALPPAKTHVPILVRAMPCQPEPDELVAGQQSIVLHPAHLGNKRRLVLQLTVTYPSANARVIEREFGRRDILCGQLANLTSDGRRDWSLFDQVTGQPDDDETSRDHCRHRCRYRPACKLTNRVPELSVVADQ